VLQFGGPVGTLAALGNDYDKVSVLLAKELNLSKAEIPWHAQRDRLVEVAAVLGLMVGSLGKMARDIALMSQSEVAEIAEPSAPDRGGSSSMPQNRNPVGCAVVLSAATRVPALVSILLSAMPQEHERGLGGWHAEWETLPEVFLLASGALFQMRQTCEGLHVDTERMRENLNATRGLVFAESVSTALARTVGRTTGHELVARACQRAVKEGRHLQEVVATDAEITKQMSAAELKSLFDPHEHVLAAARLVDEALAELHKTETSPTEGVICPSQK
jgi:3-carboxy-cis,cis-muconate cycloisomerase